MAKLGNHWTETSTEDFLYRIASDYVRQLEKIMEASPTKQSELAQKLGVTEGRVSQVLNNPGNMTLKNVVQYARALGKKVAIVAYDDNDTNNHSGPISAEIFASCWESAGKPQDFFELSNMSVANTKTVTSYITDNKAFAHGENEWLNLTTSFLVTKKSSRPWSSNMALAMAFGASTSSSDSMEQTSVPLQLK